MSILSIAVSSASMLDVILSVGKCPQNVELPGPGSKKTIVAPLVFTPDSADQLMHAASPGPLQRLRILCTVLNDL